MVNKRSFMGMLVIILSFGLFLIGCSTLPNYYNLGDVSEENCALVLVNKVSQQSKNFGFTIPIAIDQGDYNQWKGPKIPFMADGEAIVRVTPGIHSFTTKFARTGNTPTNELNIIYECRAGKGYEFTFSDEGNRAKLTLTEYIINSNGKFGGGYSPEVGKVVAVKVDGREQQ